MTFFDQSFSSNDADESERWLAAGYGRVDMDRRFEHYDERMAGDERFFLTTVNMLGTYSCVVDPNLIIVATTTPGFRWELERDAGSLSAEPALFQPEHPYLAKVSNTEIRAVGLHIDALQCTARLLYAQEDFRVRFENVHPVSEKMGAFWLAALELASREDEAGMLENELLRATTYRMLAVAALESFRLVGDRRALHASAERRRLVYRTGSQFLRDYASLPITIEDAAEAAGASVGELVLAFRSQHDDGITPTRFLHRTRLESAQDELSDGDTVGPDTVEATRAVLQRWGFRSLTGFRRQYQNEFRHDVD